MNDNPSNSKDSELLPVESVSSLYAVKFCNKLSERERRRPYYRNEAIAPRQRNTTDPASHGCA